MARLEIPSIVVHNGSSSAPGSPTMERSVRSVAALDEADEVKRNGESEMVIKKEPIDESEPKETRKDGNDGKRNGQVEEKAGHPVTRVRPSLSKMKLLQRSHAMREETSPPPDPEASAPHKSAPGNNNNNNNNTLSVRPSSRHKLSRQGSSRDSVDSASPCLSRENSTEQYTDFTGTDLEHFIMETINKNHKDRTLMLQIEQQLVNYIREKPPMRQYYKFPAMSSYQRMLVHRVAAYFGMEHNVDQPGNCVVVNRTKGTRIPELEFKEYIKEDLLFPEEPRRSILKRDSSSFDDGSFKEAGGDGVYQRGRSSPDDIRWPGDIQPWSSSESDQIPGRPRYSNHLRADSRASRLLKVESFEGGDTLKAGSLRSSVSKSYSFGGYSGSAQPRGENHSGPTNNRVLTKQDSGSSVSSRISPSSSGYKSQSQRSDATMSATPSPTATPHPHHSSQLSEGNTVMWAVTDLASVPPGSMLINPQTGQPYLNPDGSVYRYDPANPFKNKAEESKSVSTQMTPVPSMPPSPAKSASGKVNPSKNTTTTSTSPTPPPTPSDQPPPVPHQPHHLVTLSGNASHGYTPPAQVYPLSQQVDPSVLYANPPLQCHNQPPGQMMYAPVPGYSMGPYEQRQAMSAENCNMSVGELNGYFMGMNMVSDQQRGAGDTSNQSQQPMPTQQQYQTNTAQPNNYWQPHQAAAGMPMYYTIPHPGASPLLTSSPPQPQSGSGGSNQSSPRYITYPTQYQPGMPSQQDSRQHNGTYLPAGAYQMPGYGVVNPNGDCLPPGTVLPYYAPPPPPPSFAPGPGGQGGGAPTPPHQQQANQPMCPTHPYVLVNGGTSFPPVYNGGVVGGPGQGQSPPGPQPQYVPVMPSMGLFRPTMQMMCSSPPPRPPRDNGKPPYSRSPSLTSNKEQRHLDSANKIIRYPSVPVFRMMPGDIRGLVGPPLQGGLRMPFPLPPHHPNHRGGPPHPQQTFSTDNRARKPRPKSMSQVPSYNNQARPQYTSGPRGSNDNSGRMVVNSHTNNIVKHH